MMKRILCLVLSALMILSFVGCSEKTKEEDMIDIGMDMSKGTVTLSLYVMSESAVSPEQEALVEEAANKIVDKYNIKLDIRYYTEDKYYTVLEDHLKKGKDGLAKINEEPYYIDENCRPIKYYPPIRDEQVDVFYFGGYDKYQKYMDAGYLADFASDLTNEGSSLKSGISSILYENATAGSEVYMMPVNAAIGEYTYMLLNKSVLKSTQLVASDITSLVSAECADLLETVKNHYPDYVPLYSSVGALAFDDIKFFGTDDKGFASNNFSILAGTYGASWSFGEENHYPEMSGINATKDNGSLTAIEQIKALKQYEFNGYYSDEDKPFAVGYVKGGTEIFDEYGDDYEIVVLEAPTLTTEGFYENMMAINTTTSDVAKSTRLLAELYSNPELINVIVRGVEGENYIVTSSDVLDKNDEPYEVLEVQVTDDKYVYEIDPNKIGNPANVRPTVDEDPLKYERILKQNREARVDLLFGYTLYGSKVKLTPMTKIAEYSVTAYNKLVDAHSSAELDAALAEIDAMMESEEVKAIFADGGIASNYMKWLTDNKIYVAPAEEKTN